MALQLKVQFEEREKKRRVVRFVLFLLDQQRVTSQRVESFFHQIFDGSAIDTGHRVTVESNLEFSVGDRLFDDVRQGRAVMLRIQMDEDFASQVLQTNQHMTPGCHAVSLLGLESGERCCRGALSRFDNKRWRFDGRAYQRPRVQRHQVFGQSRPVGEPLLLRILLL